ncbi:hypothetical protein [Roseimicrobium gellanilyticum]|nr:hypothetical protein [Roseimicrobium gellanilyticum]
MKYAYATTLLLLAATCGVQAAKDDEKLPAIPGDGKGRYGVYTFADAKAEATKRKKPIAMIVQNDRTEEAAEKNAILKAYWGIEKDATMVMVTSRLMVEAKSRFTPESLEALSSAEAGKALPRLVVMNSDATVPLGVMSAEQIMAADEKAFKEFGKKMEDANKNPSGSKITLTPTGAKPAAPATPAATAPGAAPAGPVAIKDPKAESWTNAEGRAVQMTLVSVNGTEATFKLADGRSLPLDVSKLSDASKKRVEELVAASK